MLLGKRKRRELAGALHLIPAKCDCLGMMLTSLRCGTIAGGDKAMDLFDHARQEQIAQEAPLAARMRPRTLEAFAGQRHERGGPVGQQFPSLVRHARLGIADGRTGTNRPALGPQTPLLGRPEVVELQVDVHQAGAFREADGWVNDDALMLRRYQTVDLAYQPEEFEEITEEEAAFLQRIALETVLEHQMK